MEFTKDDMVAESKKINDLMQSLTDYMQDAEENNDSEIEVHFGATIGYLSDAKEEIDQIIKKLK